MSSIACRHLRRVVDNVRNVLAIELITGLQAVELHARLVKGLERGEEPVHDLSYRRYVTDDLEHLLSAPCMNVLKYVRNELHVPFIEHDRQLWNLIAVVQQSIARGEVLQRADAAA
jgi:histidine ammonia-lyase